MTTLEEKIKNEKKEISNKDFFLEHYFAKETEHKTPEQIKLEYPRFYEYWVDY